MPEIFIEDYGEKTRPDGEPGFIVVTPTKSTFLETDHSDVRLDRVRVFDPDGNFVRSYLRDKMGMRFVDNLENTEDDPEYLKSLPSTRQSSSQIDQEPST